MKLNRKSATFMSVLLVSPFLAAQDETDQNASAEPARLPYEVIVTPSITRADLRKLIVEVEEDMFARFNELNDDDLYDIACYQMKHASSHIPERLCEPLFMILRRGEDAKANIELMGPYKWRSVNVLNPDAMRREVQVNYDELQQMMEALTNSDLEFRSISKALLDLKAQLENFGKED